MRIVVIEDEKLTAKDLSKTILAVEPAASVVATIETVQEGIAYFRAKPSIDLIFADIQLGDGQSFEIFETVPNTIPIIFCTAFNEYALQAFDTVGIDYVLKPFSKASIQKAITKFKTITSHQTSVSTDLSIVIEQLKTQLKPTKLPNIIIHQADKIIPISGDNIALFYIDHTTVKALGFDNKIVIVQYHLDELERKFTPQFYRINRQFLINRKAIKEASQHFNRKLLVHTTLLFQEQILVPKEKITSFLEWLANC